MAQSGPARARVGGSGADRRVGVTDRLADQHPIASPMPPSTISWLSYADRLMEFPTALLRWRPGRSFCQPESA
jgi:hypothetical protein